MEPWIITQQYLLGQNKPYVCHGHDVETALQLGCIRGVECMGFKSKLKAKLEAEAAKHYNTTTPTLVPRGLPTHCSRHNQTTK